jgi:hypothetical protein
VKARILAPLAVALGLLTLAGGPVAAADAPRITRPVQATLEDLAPTRTFSSPYLLVDPNNSNNVVASAVEMRTRTCKLLRSTDSGISWKMLDASPSPASYPFCFHTSGMQTETPLAWGRDGTLYYGLVGWDHSDGGQRGNLSVLLARSNDLGDTWETTIVRNTRGLVDAAVENNSPVSAVVVDTTSGPEDIVYVMYRRSNPNATPAPHRPPMVAVSTDGGKTFGEPIEVISFYKKTVKNPANGQDVAIGMAFNAPVGAVDDKGTLYVLYPANAVSTITPPQPFPVLLAKSTDRGQSFTFTEAAPPSVYTEHVVMMRWTKQGGPQGTLHIIYEDKLDQPAKSADRDIFYTRSTDGGQTFSTPKMLNDDDPSKLAVQATPNISVSDNGRVDAVWWDFRDDAGKFANDVYYTYSEDNGATWSKNVRITDRSVNRKIGVWSNGADIRQPPGVVSTDKLAIIGWDDTRLGNDTTHTQDIFTRVVQFEALGGSNDLARYAIGAMAGLAVVGIVLLVVSAVGSRGRGAPAPAGSERQQAPV